jgi:hypothetical protein
MLRRENDLLLVLRQLPDHARRTGRPRTTRPTTYKRSHVELCSFRVCLLAAALDPIKGRGRELTRFGDEHADYLAWDLSPDGTQIVLYKEFEGRFQLLSLNRRAVDEIRVTGGAQLRTMSWAADGKGLFAANAIQQGAQLLYIDLRGNAHVLWQLRGRDAFVWGRPSPDGRRLAILAGAGTANIWMMENF